MCAVVFCFYVFWCFLLMCSFLSVIWACCMCAIEHWRSHDSVLLRMGIQMDPEYSGWNGWFWCELTFTSLLSVEVGLRSMMMGCRQFFCGPQALLHLKPFTLREGCQCTKFVGCIQCIRCKLTIIHLDALRLQNGAFELSCCHGHG